VLFRSIIVAFVASTVLVTKRLNAKKAAVVEALKREDEESIRRAEYEAALAEYHQRHAAQTEAQPENPTDA
jgi:Arc/MetJ family transcription regulator